MIKIIRFLINSKMKLIKYPTNVPLVRRSVGLFVRNHRNSVKLKTSGEDSIPPLKAGETPSVEQVARSSKIVADFLLSVSQVSPDARGQYRLVKIPNGMTVDDLENLFNNLSLIGLRSRRRGDFYGQQSESVRRHLKSAKARISTAKQKKSAELTNSDIDREGKSLNDNDLTRYKDFLIGNPEKMEKFLTELKSTSYSNQNMDEIDENTDESEKTD
jgi:hypothetical protein